MRIVTRIIALTRSIQLNRQFREIEKSIAELPLANRRQLAAIAMLVATALVLARGHLGAVLGPDPARQAGATSRGATERTWACRA